MPDTQSPENPQTPSNHSPNPHSQNSNPQNPNTNPHTNLHTPPHTPHTPHTSHTSSHHSPRTHTILYSCMRSFFSALCAMGGIGLGLVVIITAIAALFGDIDLGLEIKSHFSPTILPNAQDIRKELSSDSPVMLKINISGMIGSEKLNMYSIGELLTESKEGLLKNNRVKAILLHINSPGGTVTDSDGIYHAIKEFKEQNKIPVYAYVDGLCASGGMYIAAAADKVYASDASLIGSVGVLLPPFFNFTKLIETLGVESKTITAGTGKDDMNPFRPWKPDEDKTLKNIVDYYYNSFIDIVTTNRPNLDRKLLIEEYGARVFPAAIAAKHGYIDGNGYSLSQTMQLLAKEANLEEGKYQVIKLDRKVSFSDIINRDSPMMTGTVKHQFDFGAEFDPKFMNQFLYLYVPN